MARPVFVLLLLHFIALDHLAGRTLRSAGCIFVDFAMGTNPYAASLLRGSAPHGLIKIIAGSAQQNRRAQFAP
jgi:hypothetical protein